MLGAKSGHCSTETHVLRLGENKKTYRTIEHAVSLIPAFLDVILQGARIERLEQLKTAEQLGRN
jgi:hypothetical protein